ncbi:MAG: hypothetical protein ACRC42_01045 [Mycoplasma sp.]
MLNINNEMNKVILFFTIKHNGNWEKIYNSIKTKQPITLVEMNTISDKYGENYIAIIDNHYPENFKSIYMPPLSLFTIGNKKLLFQDEEIVSLWDKSGYDRISANKLDKNKVYAILFNKEEIDNINLLVSDGYKLILVESDIEDKNQLSKIKDMTNVVYITEIPFEVNKPDFDFDQTKERVLLGVSKDAIAFEFTKDIRELVIPLFEFEKRNLSIFEKLDEKTLIKYQNIERFKKEKNN